jgi:hypothetical protein
MGYPLVLHKFSILCKIGLWTKVQILSVKEGNIGTGQVDGAESPLEADAELGYVDSSMEIKV